ncbi:MAG: tyrosine-type recombinase/integrase [Opitutaceae bacterium]
MRKPIPKVRKNKDGGKNSAWVVDGLRVEGKRVRKFFPSEAKANIYMRKKVAQMEREGTAGMAIPTELRVEAVKCAVMLEPYGKTLTDAVEAYVARLKAVQKSCTVSEMVVEMLKGKKQDGIKGRTLKDLRLRLGRFEKEFADRSIAEIETAEIDDWLRSLGLGPQSRNNYHSVVRTLMSYGIDRGYTERNPAARATRVKVPKGLVSHFKPDQMRALLKHSDESFRPFLAIAGFAGLRSSEVFRLDWSDVNVEERKILVSADTKTAAARFVTIPENLAAWLRPLAKESGAVASENQIRTSRTHAWKAAGMEKWDQNALRHSYASYHYALHGDAGITASQLGHSNNKMLFSNYRGVVSSEAAKEWFEIVPESNTGE